MPGLDAALDSSGMRERWAGSSGERGCGREGGPMASGCRALGGLTSRLPSLRQPLPSDAFSGWGSRTGRTRGARPGAGMRGGAGGAGGARPPPPPAAPGPARPAPNRGAPASNQGGAAAGGPGLPPLEGRRRQRRHREPPGRRRRGPRRLSFPAASRGSPCPPRPPRVPSHPAEIPPQPRPPPPPAPARAGVAECRQIAAGGPRLEKGREGISHWTTSKRCFLEDALSQ